MKILLLLILFFGKFLHSQEIISSVNVDLQMLDQDKQINVQTLASDLKKYIDNTNFLGKDWEGPRIPVDLSIVLSGGYNNFYTARMIVTSQRNVGESPENKSNVLRMIEIDWAFEYQRGAFHTYNPLLFNNFISIVDYYMLLAIGSDLDTYFELGGTEAFNKAKQIVLLGSNSNAKGFDIYSQPGEYTKYNLVTELLDTRIEGWRKLVNSFFLDGIDLLATDKETAINNMIIIISQMADFKREKLTGPSVAIQVFFEAKVSEIAQAFKGNEDKDLFANLMYLDSGNSLIYQKSQRGD